MGSVALHTALIWHDEVMHDLVFEKPRRITLGRDGRSTFTVPELGLPGAFAILRPGNRGYLLTLGARMRGTICLDGTRHDVVALIAASPDGFAGTPISERDWGVIELDESGHHKLFFQFVPAEEPVRWFTTPVLAAGVIGYCVSSAALTLLWALKGVPIAEAAFRGVAISTIAMVVGGYVWSALRKDGESMASLAFSVVLHAALLFMTFQVYTEDDPFVWPGMRSLAADYIVARLDSEPPPPKPTTGKTIESAAPAPASTPREPAPITPAIEPSAGGQRGGDRQPAPRVALLAPRNREVLQELAGRDVMPGLAKFMGLEKPTLGPGSGPGRGSEVGSTTKGNGPAGNTANDGYKAAPKTLNVGPVRDGTCTGPGCRGTAPRGVVDFEAVTGVLGGLTSGEIDEVVKRRAGIFRTCYQRQLDRKPGLGGKIVMHFRIGGDGLVVPGDTASIDGTTLHDAEVERCVIANINRLKFAAKGGVANVNYPFVFVQGG